MISQLQLLLSVRELRVNRIRAELMFATTALAEVEAELDGINEELAQIARQRAAWERAWQHWLHQDGVIRHGQDYSLAHTALSAWERDANQIHQEVSARHAQAFAQVLSIRARLLKAEQLLDVLREQLRTMQRRDHVRRIALAESRSQDEPRVLTSH
jgi:septation ring formation regulator EzrA